MKNFKLDDTCVLKTEIFNANQLVQVPMYGFIKKIGENYNFVFNF